MIRIKIPATSANLGAGFDSLGLALNLYNYINMEFSDKIDISSADSTKVPTGENNLVYSSAEYLFNLAGKKLDGLKIIQENNVPMTRGLGSSSTCIVGGLVGANALLNNIYSTEDIVNIAARIEGHPDNTTPAILGGIVTSALYENRVYYTKQDVVSDLNFIALVPDFKLSTALARNCLPTEISHADARFNISRASLFATSLLQGKYENLKVAVDDKLHQPYRLELIKFGREVFKQAYDNSAYAVYISGAGPTIMSIVSRDNASFISKMRVFLNNNNLRGWDIKKLSVDNIGTTIENI